jgi:hypothetical protein
VSIRPVVVVVEAFEIDDAHIGGQVDGGRVDGWTGGRVDGWIGGPVDRLLALASSIV